MEALTQLRLSGNPHTFEAHIRRYSSHRFSTFPMGLMRPAGKAGATVVIQSPGMTVSEIQRWMRSQWFIRIPERGGYRIWAVVIQSQYGCWFLSLWGSVAYISDAKILQVSGGRLNTSLPSHSISNIPNYAGRHSINPSFLHITDSIKYSWLPTATVLPCQSPSQCQANRSPRAHFRRLSHPVCESHPKMRSPALIPCRCMPLTALVNPKSSKDGPELSPCRRSKERLVDLPLFN